LFVRRREDGSAAYARRSASSRANQSSIAEIAHGYRMSLIDEVLLLGGHWGGGHREGSVEHLRVEVEQIVRRVGR
jgi:hypothetical protein